MKTHINDNMLRTNLSMESKRRCLDLIKTVSLHELRLCLFSWFKISHTDVEKLTIHTYNAGQDTYLQSRNNMSQ